MATPPSRTTTVVRLVEIAERLFAQHGLDGVSLRQIASEAGSANNSVVRYHFGSKDELVTAILEHRLPDIIERREILSARTDPDDLRAVVEAHLLPVVDLAEASDNHYLMFLEQLQRYGGDNHPFLEVSASLRDSHRRFVKTTGALLGHLPKELRAIRITSMTAMCLHASADRQRARQFGTDQLPYALHVNHLFDALVGYLLAPASPATLRALFAANERRATAAPRNES
jgi:AcrR family transcriptional regulator